MVHLRHFCKNNLLEPLLFKTVEMCVCLDAAYQSVKNQNIIVISLRMFHHNVEKGVQGVLQELHTHTHTHINKCAYWTTDAHV